MLQVDSNGAGIEQRLSNLQAQIDGLRQAATPDALPIDERLSTFTDQSASILKIWAATAERHASAVSQLERQLREFGDAGTRLQEDAALRLQELERIVQQEWAALRDLHEAPVRQLVEQAASLTEVCIAAANSAQHGFDRAEARLAALEADVHRATAELTRELQTVLTEVRHLSSGASRQLPSDGPAWPLEGVTRLHQQLREASGVTLALSAADAPAASAGDMAAQPTSMSAASLDADHALTSDVAPIADHPARSPHEDVGIVTSAEPARTPAIGGSLWRPIATVATVVLLAAGLFGWRLQRDVTTAKQQAEESRRQSQLAAEAASRQAAERQRDADRQLTAARELAARAQVIGDVLAAPDLLRYTLVGGPALTGATGQVLWSRSRGFVFSASGLPAPGADMTYQVWLLTRAGPVSAATFVPDDSGRVTVTTTPAITRGVYGAVVTAERQGGAASPTGAPVLLRVTPAPPTVS